MVTATATRKSAKTNARKAPKHTPALQRVIPYQEKVRLMHILTTSAPYSQKLRHSIPSNFSR
jgi:hypothetical protein